MGRRRTAAFAGLACATLALGAVACGDAADESPRIERSRLAPAEPVAPRAGVGTVDEGAELVESLVVWPEGAGAPRDARDDYRTCQKRLDARNDVRNAHPLVRFDFMRECMEAMGWAMNPDAGIPEK